MTQFSVTASDPNPSTDQLLAHAEETIGLLRQKGKRVEAEVERLRLWIDSEGRNCPSNATVDAFLRERDYA